MRRRRFPPAIALRLRLWHRVLNLRDHVRRIVADLRRGHRPLWRGWKVGCAVCGSRFWTFCSKNWCVHCFTRWPHWHESTGYARPTRLDVWRGAEDVCVECGGYYGHSSFCAAVD